VQEIFVFIRIANKLALGKAPGVTSLAIRKVKLGPRSFMETDPDSEIRRPRQIPRPVHQPPLYYQPNEKGVEKSLFGAIRENLILAIA
jgi:hypothetical protein